MQCPLDGSPSCGAELLVEAQAKAHIAMMELPVLIPAEFLKPGWEAWMANNLRELKADYEVKYAKR